MIDITDNLGLPICPGRFVRLDRVPAGIPLPIQPEDFEQGDRGVEGARFKAKSDVFRRMIPGQEVLFYIPTDWPMWWQSVKGAAFKPPVHGRFRVRRVHRNLGLVYREW